VQLLLEDIAGIEREEPSDTGGPDPEASLRLLLRFRRRAIFVIALDWAALLILVILRTRSGALFSIGPSEESIFAIGALAIAVHSGFRLGQLEKLAAVRRVLNELAERARPLAGPRESS
jgi:hypothetical protein